MTCSLLLIAITSTGEMSGTRLPITVAPGFRSVTVVFPTASADCRLKESIITGIIITGTFPMTGMAMNTGISAPDGAVGTEVDTIIGAKSATAAGTERLIGVGIDPLLPVGTGPAMEEKTGMTLAAGTGKNDANRVVKLYSIGQCLETGWGAWAMV